MKEFGWNMTVYAIAVAMERNPTFAKACVREGHEICAHGYRWLDIWEYGLEEDKEYIRKTLLKLEEVTGKWCQGSPRCMQRLTSSRRISCWCILWQRHTKHGQPSADCMERIG